MESTLDQIKASDIYKDIPGHARDHLHIYHYIKAHTNVHGDTYERLHKLRQRMAKPPKILKKKVQKYYIPADRMKEALRFLVDNNVLVIEENKVYPYKLWMAERTLASGIDRLIRNSEPWKFDVNYDA